MKRTAFYDESLNRLQEGLDLDQFVIATYVVGLPPDADPVFKAVALGVEQSTGSWTPVPAETPELREKYAAKTLGVYEVPDYANASQLNPNQDLRWYVMRIAFPAVNFKNNIPLMMTTVAGNISLMSNLKLVDLEFGKEFIKDFQGPKFGIEGLRKITNCYGRPFLNNMIKPCTGYTAEVGAKLFYEAASSGVDIIKDDELIAGDKPFNKLLDRLKLCMKAAKKADAEKGEKTLYAINITDEVGKLKEHAMKVIENGGNCIMVNAFGVGFSALRALAEDPDITVPIMAHNSYSGAACSSPYQGVSLHVLTKIIRLCGADIFVNASPYGKFDLLKSNYTKYTKAAQGKFYDIEPTVLLYGGGVIPQLVEQTIADAGIDCIFGVGAGIHGHPSGAKAGAKAMRQAIDAAVNGVDFLEAGKQNKELGEAIKVWGPFEDEDREIYAL